MRVFAFSVYHFPPTDLWRGGSCPSRALMDGDQKHQNSLKSRMVLSRWFFPFRLSTTKATNEPRRLHNGSQASSHSTRISADNCFVFFSLCRVLTIKICFTTLRTRKSHSNMFLLRLLPSLMEETFSVLLFSLVFVRISIDPRHWNVCALDGGVGI